MEYLTGKCKIDFINFTLEKYGYSNIYYLGLPIILKFFDDSMDYEFPKINEIGELKEIKTIELTILFIKQMNKLYNETFTDNTSCLPPIKELNTNK
jgi:hypothetical protein